MFRSRCCCCILCSLIGLFLAWLLLADTATPVYSQPPKGPVSFINDVAPILKENCFSCHDAKKKKGKFEMTTYENFRKGGTKDDPVTPGKPKESVIIDLLTSTGKERMPPKDNADALSKEKIAVIAKWIEEGAKIDQGLDPKADLWRELRIRWKPPQPPLVYKDFPFLVNALAFTLDSKKIVVGCYHELTVWDVAQAKLEKRIYTRAERAKAMAFLPDGKLAVAGSRPGQEGDVRIYNINAPGKDVGGVTVLDGVHDKNVLLKELLETDDEVLTLAVSPDGKKLASGGCDRLVRVWDLASGKLEHSVENHADWVFGVVFSPDNKFLVTGSRDKTAKVWDLVAKESVLTFPDHQNPVYGVGITSDGKTGFSCGEDGNLREWQATDASKQIGKQIRAMPGGKSVFKVAYHADPKVPLLATCSADATVRLFNAATGAALKTLSGHTDYVFAVAISPDGQLVAGGSNNGEVRIWKTGDGAPVKDFNASPGYVAKTAAAPKK
jgi:mono/diheme cytochrome c family protein